jgi:hypothetical protein
MLGRAERARPHAFPRIPFPVASNFDLLPPCAYQSTQVHLREAISALPDGLSAFCAENGDNLSVGQRQVNAPWGGCFASPSAHALCCCWLLSPPLVQAPQCDIAAGDCLFCANSKLCVRRAPPHALTPGPHTLTPSPHTPHSHPYPHPTSTPTPRR